MTSTTECLCALLDERGVEWHDTKIGKGFITVYEHDGITWIVTEHSSGRLSVKGCVKPTQGHYDGMTPEQAIADRIDAEHEAQLNDAFETRNSDENLENDGWVRLPKDADGEYIQPSDIPHLTKVKDGKRLAYYPSLELRQDGTWRLAGWTLDRYRIIKPNVEDVMVEFATDWECAQDGEDKTAVLKEYAAKLRLAEGEDA